MLNEAQTTEARILLLLQMHAQHPEPIDLKTLSLGLRVAGLAGITDDIVRSNLEALVESGFAKAKPSPMNAALLRWTITEEGRVCLVTANRLA